MSLYVWINLQQEREAYILKIRDNLGRSILHLAVQRGNVPLIGYLFALPNGKDLGTPDYDGQTLLHYAAETRRTHTIDLLLDAGFRKLEAKDYKGRTIMLHAASRGNLDAVKRIVELGCLELLDVQDCGGLTPLQLADDFLATECVEYLSLLRPNEKILLLSEGHSGTSAKRLGLYRHSMLKVVVKVVACVIFGLVLWAYGFPLNLLADMSQATT